MARVKRGSAARQKHKKILKRAKGFRGGFGTIFRQAKPAVWRAQRNEYQHRRLRKRDFRNLWTVRINAALEALGVSYSKFINQLKKAGITLNRKALSELATNRPEVFNAVVKAVQ